MTITKLTVKTPDGVEIYENARIVEPGTCEDVFGELVEAIQPDFEIICSDGKRVKIEFNSLVNLVI